MISNIQKKIIKLDYKTVQLVKNAFQSFAIKGIAMFVSLFTMPAYIRFFDNQIALGMWFTAISILSWILTFDLGIGNGLRNHLVEPLVNKQHKEVKKYISSAYISMSIVAVIFILIGIIIFPYIKWNYIFNISEEIVSEKTLLYMMLMLFISTLINFVLKLINSILYALQKSALPSFLSLISSIILLIFISTTKSKGLEENIIKLSQVNIIAINFPLIIATIVLFGGSLKKCLPSFKYYQKEYAAKVIKLGSVFFWAQIMTMLMFGTNEFLITWFANPEDVVTFQIYNKAFMIICTLFNLAITPVWSAVREACVKEDFNWIKKLYRKLNLALILVIPLEMLLIIFLQPLINIWLGENTININYMYAILFAIYNTLYIKVIIDTSIISGLGKLKIQVIALTITTIIKIILSVLIMHVIPNWIVIIFANIIALIPYIIIEYFDIKNQMSYFKGRKKAK